MKHKRVAKRVARADVCGRDGRVLVEVDDLFIPCLIEEKTKRNESAIRSSTLFLRQY